MEVPRTLRSWFVVNAAVSVVAALPLLVAPALVLRRLGWTTVDPVTARLAAAALLAIGAASFWARDGGVDVYRALLRLNLIWSLAAASALFAGIGAGAPPAAWAFLSIFICLAGVWLHHAIRFRQLDRAAALDDSPEEEAPPPDGPN
jgi:hypothetical protein